MGMVLCPRLTNGENTRTAMSLSSLSLKDTTFLIGTHHGVECKVWSSHHCGWNDSVLPEELFAMGLIDDKAVLDIQIVTVLIKFNALNGC
jgi:hypothetical protein